MNIVKFFLNGKAVTLENPSPDLLLLDYLRSEEVGLTGAKKGCGQGGCGACTVILSEWNEEKNRAEHHSINSCLRPVCALDGLSVTTVEGTGSMTRPENEFLHHAPVASRGAAPLPSPDEDAKEANPLLFQARKKIKETHRKLLGLNRDSDPMDIRKIADAMNPVAHRLALNNGSQCGYCSVGWVMNMSAFLAENPSPTKREIEDIFDGNICRCTGYRAILTGMKTFASDWSEEDEKNRMECITEDVWKSLPISSEPYIPFPNEARTAPQPVEIQGNKQTWQTAATLDELSAIVKRNRDKTVRFIHGNTSYGIYKEEFHAADLLVDIRLIPDLYGIEETAAEIAVGAAVTYTNFLDRLKTVIEKKWNVRLPEDLQNPQWDRPTWATSALGVAHFMAHRTAGMIVRNAASLGGNTMLTFKHIHAGEPFPSDLLTALTAIIARIEFLEVSSGNRLVLTVEEIVDRIVKNAAYADDIVLIRYHIPTGEKDEIVLAQKVALREVNSHSIVNAATNLTVDKNLRLEKAALIFGGIAPFPWHASDTEKAMTGETLSLELFDKLQPILKKEVTARLEAETLRMKGLVSEGFTNEYRTDLATSFLYKAIVNALVQRKVKIPENVRSSGEITWGRWAVSDGTQHYQTQTATDPKFKAPVAEPYIKLMSLYQASGQVHYTHEIPLPPGGLNAAFVQSRRALSDYHLVKPHGATPVSPAKLREHLHQKFPAFVDLITYREVPSPQYNFQGMGGDQPLFAVKQVSYVGQSIALVLANSEQDAIDIAAYVTEECVGYAPVNWGTAWNPIWNKPVLSLEQAIEMNSVFPDQPASAPFASHIWKITRTGSRFDWLRSKKPLDKQITNRVDKVDGAPCRIVESTQTTGGQAHFYMETQACVALPADGDRFIVHPSSQSPMEMHQTAAMALNVEYNRIDVRIQQVGGGFGGKTEQARFVTGPAVVAAKVTQKPVRLVMPRENDTQMIGKRHPYYGQYQIAVDLGENDPRDRGLIRGMHSKLWGDGGAFYDCSYIVSNCIQLRMDNAYKVANFESQIDVCRTNTAPNTAMRAFGDVQAMLIVENAVDDAAYSIGMLPEELREKNLYERGDVTPFGQALSYCYMKEVWNYLKEQCNYAQKRAEVDDFNAKNKWRKRGLCLLPVKYGNGYNLAMLEQAAAIVSVYSNDGTIIINQGGVDMGQGLITQITQIASYVLNVPMDMIQVEMPRTSVIPNPTSTGGSTGTAYSGEAVKQACEDMRSRLTEFGYKMLREHGDTWCHNAGIDFWNYGKKGWATVTSPPNGTAKIIWQNLVTLAWQNRVSLVSTFTAPIRGGETPIPAMTFKPKAEQPNIPGIQTSDNTVISGIVDSFTGFTYSAACSEVEVDILTGEVKILRSDIVYDMGWSLNPALDIGQVEGAFVQGIGYVLTEKLVFEPDGEEQGRLNTDNTWRYKPPATSTIPLQMNTYLFPRDLASSVPEEPDTLFSSKEVGEPPLVLANSVFFAVKAAVRASRVERGLDGLFRLDAPATVQEVRRACAD
ncbi:MAG TPA: molybdopterin cofactor-binding domain-containing protein [Pyrinomonadaceae bacterium]|jgi:xanthine dehydrogenase/oxidase